MRLAEDVASKREIDTVIDFGCGSGMQGYLFEGVRYIGVDDCNAVDVCRDGNEICKMTIQEFIEGRADEFDQESTLALCLNVPDQEARELVGNTFENAEILRRGEWM